MKNVTITLVFLITVSISYGQSLIGTWRTFDDETGKEESYVKIYQKGKQLFGKITKLVEEKSRGAICTACTDEYKDKPVEGLDILMELTKDDDRYEGKLLYPKDGKIYSCYLELEEDNKLKVRAYIGTPFLGRTQYWQRKL